MENKMYNWGILGPGNIAHKFAEALAVVDKAKLFAVGSRALERAEKFANQYGAERWYGNYDEMFKDDDIDIVYIATPNNSHYELSRKCLENGKHVLCEKPIALNSHQFEEVKKIAREKRLFYMDALWTRFLPHIKRILEIKEEGILGEIKNLRADFGFKAEYDPAHRIFNPALGGGALLDIGIYPVFLSLIILGYPDEIEVVSVKAPSGVDESDGISLKYANGEIASLSCTFSAHTGITAEISGANGRIDIHSLFFIPTTFDIYLHGEKHSHHEFPILCNGYEYEIIEVMKCLDSGLTESPDLSLDFTSELMRLLDEIRKKAGIVYDVDPT